MRRRVVLLYYLACFNFSRKNKIIFSDDILSLLDMRCSPLLLKGKT